MKTDQATPILLYKVRNAFHEIGTLLDEHNMCDGATEETHLVRGRRSGCQFVCAKDAHRATEREAWAEYAIDLVEAISREEKTILETEARICGWRKELRKSLLIDRKLSDCS